MKKVLTFLLAFIILLGSVSFASSEETSSMESGNNVMSELSDTQRNSIGVLNYLAFLTRDIESRKDQRIYLEEAYSALYNNTYMSAIDEVTLGQVKSLLTTLYNFRMVAVKRERLQYIYEQSQAQAIRDAIPSPLAIMNIIQSGSWQKALISVVYMAVDSVTSYQNSKSAAEMSFLQSGWELDDEESEIIHNEHLDSLEYMWEIIHDYDLPAELAINETDIDNFVDWKSKTNLVGRIQFLESNQEVYQAFGEYWLTLAESYYENGNMEKCLQAVGSYETYSTRIFRKDYHYAKVLPMAITAAAEVYDNDKYVTEATRFANRIVANTEQDDWALRYFAAETYIDLAGRTSDKSYLQKAYDVALNNVNHLVQEQIEKNEEYLADVKLETAAADATEAKKKEIEQYNNALKAARKIALPPVSDALVLNCDLLAQLADTLEVDNAEREKINSILYGHGDVLFLCPEMDWVYAIDGDHAIDASSIVVAFDGKTIQIPAQHLTENAKISVGGLDMATGKVFTIDDWELQSVERSKASDLSTFTATYTSKTASSTAYSEGSTVWINLNPSGDDHTQTIQISYNVVSKTDFIIPYLAFERIDE